MRIADALHRAARRLRAIVDRLRRRSLALAAAGLGVLACDHGATRLDLTAPAVAVAPAIDAGLEVAPPPPPAEEPIGRFQMTFYFIIHEAEMTPANDNAVAGSAVAGSAVAGAPDAGVDSTEVTLAAAGPGGDLVPLNDQRCRPLAHVTRAFADQVQLQGTGKLRDGRLVNVATRCQCGRPCFHIVAASKEWGTGGSGKPLSPFRSVAVDPAIVPLGTTLYIPALDGVRMPGPRGVGGFIHDGCVIAVDTGGGIDGHQLDLFVGRRAYYKALARKGGSHGWAKSVEVWRGRGRCEYMGAGKVRRAAAGGT